MKLRIWFIKIVVDVIERLIFYPKLKKFYLKRILINDLLSHKNKLTVLDVGCNRGQTIEFFLKIDKQAHIYGFEPNPTLFKALAKKHHNNTNIKLKNIGISSKSGTLPFYQNVMDETSTFEKVNHDSKYLKKKAKVLGVTTEELVSLTYDVEVMTLSTFINNHPQVFVDIIKIDVEGHEFDCLLGIFDGSVAKIPIKFIQIESHDNDMLMVNNASKIDELLMKNGFEEVHRIKHSFGDFFEVIYENKRLNEA